MVGLFYQVDWLPVCCHYPACAEAVWRLGAVLALLVTVTHWPSRQAGSTAASSTAVLTTFHHSQNNIKHSPDAHRHPVIIDTFISIKLECLYCETIVTPGQVSPPVGSIGFSGIYIFRILNAAFQFFALVRPCMASSDTKSSQDGTMITEL